MLISHVFSILSHISPRTLTRYEGLGILPPNRIDSSTGERFYTPKQLSLADKIQALRKIEFDLSAVRELLRQYPDEDALKDYLISRYEEMKKDFSIPAEQLIALRAIIWQMEQDYSTKNYVVKTNTLPPRKVASLHRIVTAYHRQDLLWELLVEEIAGQNVQFADPMNPTTLFFDRGYRDNDPEMEVQIGVVGNYKDTANVRFKTTKQVFYASCMMTGSRTNICEINRILAEWILENQYRFHGHPFNIYHRYLENEPDPSKWLTEVCFPICKADTV